MKVPEIVNNHFVWLLEVENAMFEMLQNKVNFYIFEISDTNNFNLLVASFQLLLFLFFFCLSPFGLWLHVPCGVIPLDGKVRS